MERLGIIIGIHDDKPTSRLVILGTKPILYKIKYLASNVQSLAPKLIRNALSPDKNCREVDAAFGIWHAALETVFGRLSYIP